MLTISDERFGWRRRHANLSYRFLAPRSICSGTNTIHAFVALLRSAPKPNCSTKREPSQISAHLLAGSKLSSLESTRRRAFTRRGARWRVEMATAEEQKRHSAADSERLMGRAVRGRPSSSGAQPPAAGLSEWAALCGQIGRDAVLEARRSRADRRLTAGKTGRSKGARAVCAKSN